MGSKSQGMSERMIPPGIDFVRKSAKIAGVPRFILIGKCKSTISQAVIMVLNVRASDPQIPAIIDLFF